MTFDGVDAPWWPYLFILLGGAVATDIWRWIGVLAGSRLSQDSLLLVWVRTTATGLVAGVIGQLLLFPSGALAAAPIGVRIAAAAIGWTAFRLARNSIVAGVLVGEAVLLGGWRLLS
ncbi:AzlD domain-containing protein [Propylenella binzhouense]|uniref:AzlD domain-containing protein n=1 Tax=Propylenella binzhouense TaxID=2555902 RepID=A0A964T340_9HYPH|nr:AzlD domain-containing protein [Propylenella binzhouense]MYZ46662.1 AzlD domain-containing protein [Propylenella binzhouense]